MKTIKTLDELYKLAGSSQVTAQEILNGRTHILGEWQDVKFSEELKEEVISKIVESAGGQEKTKSQMFYSLRNERPQHWALARFLLVKYEDRPAYISYCAGQDMTWEMKELRKKLK